MKILSNEKYNDLVNKPEQIKKELQEEFDKKLELARKEIEIDGKKQPVTPGPSSVMDIPIASSFDVIQASLRILPPDFEFEVIPLIRKLAKVNPDVSQALTNLVQLANTGHKIKFDPSVGEDQVEAMRNFIIESSKSWHVGAAGMNGIVNKMFRQPMIGGASSVEWVPNMQLNNLEGVKFINPETIRFVVDKNFKGYQPYQRPKNLNILENIKSLRKLNTLQYKYYALNGDTDLPYGCPPYLAALDPIATQRHMIDNIKFIVTLLGAFGYIMANMEKPDQAVGEQDEAYIARCNKILTDLKERVKQGTRDGVMVGFKDDHEFEFKETTKNATGVKDIFDQNELLIASGLNYDTLFMGRPGATETLVTVMFTKMLAQLKNIQDVVGEQLEFGYRFALTLGGFKFKRLQVEFNKSTILDDYKFQQALEIKIRNLEHLYDQGIVGQDLFADELGYIKPDQAEPRITREKPVPGDGAMDPQTKKKVKGGKNKSARKTRDASKPRGTIKKSGASSNDSENDTRIIKIGGL